MKLQIKHTELYHHVISTITMIFTHNNTMSLSLGLDLDDVCSFIHFLCTSCMIPC